MEPTPTEPGLPLRSADFSTLTEALDYAAQGSTGANFYTGRGELAWVLPYAELRSQARLLARRLCSLGLERGARLAVVAETTPDFLHFFFGCQYAGLVPVPLPASVNLGGRDAYVQRLHRLLWNCQASAAVASEGFLPYLTEATAGLNLSFFGSPATFSELRPASVEPLPSGPEEMAYMQYTSGSTRFPRGVMVTHRAVMSNLAGIVHYGLEVRLGDRCVSWLPYYHDMGLVGFVLGPVASQMSVDYLSSHDFAMRPRQWLALISRNRATLSFSPTFGYELCARRLRAHHVAGLDLSSWRVAGVGAETIRPRPLVEFAEILKDAGFDQRAFLSCYGMAEASLAVSFASLGQGLQTDRVDGDHLALYQEAVPIAEGDRARVNHFVDCGAPLPGYEISIQDIHGQALAERQCGIIHVRGPSIMAGYFGDLEATREVLSADGWLNTGDIGYRVDNRLVITGRQTDLIIINGRNIWPQELEELAEQQPEIRPGDVSAFAVPDSKGEEKAVMVVQYREFDTEKRTALVERIQQQVRQELGVDCTVELVPPHTLPRTSSGKLSRSGARQEFLHRRAGVQTGSSSDYLRSRGEPLTEASTAYRFTSSVWPQLLL